MKSTIHPTQRPKRLPHAVWKPLGKETVLLNTESGAYFSTNTVGLAIWEACDGTRSLDDITAQVAKSFGVPSTRVARDATRFIAELHRRQLLDLLSPRTA